MGAKKSSKKPLPSRLFRPKKFCIRERPLA